jgi:hypothetical protein
VPAQLSPRGFNFYGPATDDESFAISAPGAFNPPPAFFFPETHGTVGFLANTGLGLEVNALELTGLKDFSTTSVNPDSAPGDLFGARRPGATDGNKTDGMP